MSRYVNILEDNKNTRFDWICNILLWQHLLWVWIQLHIHEIIIKQWELRIYKSTPVKKENWLCKIKIVFCRRTSSMFSCVHKSTSTGISVSNQSLQCGSSSITLYDGRCCVSSYLHVLLQFHFHIVPALGCVLLGIWKHSETERLL